MGVLFAEARKAAAAAYARFRAGAALFFCDSPHDLKTLQVLDKYCGILVKYPND
jgi:hypothetical protein